MLTFTIPLGRSGDRDPPPAKPVHVPFFMALESASGAWSRALETTCAGLVTDRGLGLVNVNSDFRRELFTGPARFTVALERIGTSSIAFRIGIEQYDVDAATVLATLAQVDASRTRSVAFSSEQRRVLAELQQVSAS